MSAYDFIDTLAVQILTYKKEHNETAAQFAKGCGVSAATIRRIENGDANVKLSTADKLLRYMNITLIDLLPPLATESPIAEGKERPRNKEATPAPQGEVAEKKILFSELLANIPSDEVLFQLDRERGNLTGGRKRHRVSNQDLYLLQQRLAGHTYRSIGEELGMSPKAVRHRILRIKVGLKWYLAVDLDVPALFN